jgi:hypothetical protein
MCIELCRTVYFVYAIKYSTVTFLSNIRRPYPLIKTRMYSTSRHSPHIFLRSAAVFTLLSKYRPVCYSIPASFSLDSRTTVNQIGGRTELNCYNFLSHLLCGIQVGRDTGIDYD